MKYRLLGKSGLRVSEAALSTMTFGDEWGWGSPKAEARRVYETYREAVSRGGPSYAGWRSPPTTDGCSRR
jgi:aryl-alcohol dehydrogenase-like predicted oxidoreductase